MNQVLSSFAYFLLFFVIPVLCEGEIRIVEQCNKAITHAPDRKVFIDFKQTLADYMQHIDQLYSASIAQEKESYQKEIRYLFKNYEKFSALTLLTRLQAAHFALTKNSLLEKNYVVYDQMCNALLIVCAEAFCNQVRLQLLSALKEIDLLLSYWRYQQNHFVRYFFSKSPIKWIHGKNQNKEIMDNIKKLERRQAQLYTALGILLEHKYNFASASVNHKKCYDWIEQLIRSTSYIEIKDQTLLNNDNEQSQFNIIATRLECKLKSSYSLKKQCLKAIYTAIKPHHIVRNWISYTIAIAVIVYCIDYNNKSSDVVAKNFHKIHLAFQSIIKSIVIDPMLDLWKVFFKRDSEKTVTRIDATVAKIEKLVETIESQVAVLTDPSVKSLKAYSLEWWNNVLSRGNVPNKEEILQELSKGNLSSSDEWWKKKSWYYYDDKIDAGLANVLLEISIICDYLQKYPELIDQGIVPLVQQIGFLVADVGKVTSDVIKNNFWTAKLAAITPLAGGCLGAAKLYQWATKRNYSPIRVALADINSLLIESELNLDNQDYGKLIYLLYKLRHKALFLKDSLAQDFLRDVEKLESKQYSPSIKHAIVNNMFNKYAFLGRISP